MGSLVIDFGAGTTEYVVYSNGIIKHSGVLAVGGDHVTNDLAVGLKIPLQYAEQLKLSHGRAIMDASIKGQTVTVYSDNGVNEGTANLEHLCRIMTVRLEEIFELIADDLEKAELLDEIRAGVFLCGGGSRIPQIHTLAEKILQMPAYQGRTSTTSGIKHALDQPEFTAAIGLVRFGSMQVQQRRVQEAMSTGIANRIGRLFGWDKKESKSANVEF
jgi:cell division protein FtsA